MIEEQITHIWGLHLFHKRSNPHRKRWKVGENGEWEFKNRKEALLSIDKDMVKTHGLLSNKKMVAIKVHKSLPKYTESLEHLQSPKAYPVYEDTALPFPGYLVAQDENNIPILCITTCFKKWKEDAYIEM
jgi:hypothetical protein